MMDYRYKKSQFWRKKLPVPDEIIEKVYKGNLALNDFFKYDLVDKIPVECLGIYERELIQRFGVDVLRDLDWEMYYKSYQYHKLLMQIEPNVLDLNMEFYKAIAKPDKYNFLKPESVTERFKETMSELFVEDLDIPDDVKREYYSRNLDIFTVIEYWEQFKNKDLQQRLDHYNRDIDIDKFISMMNEYPEVAKLVRTQTDIIKISEELYSSQTKDEKEKVIIDFCQLLLEQSKNNLKPETYKIIFKYINPDEYLKERIEYLRYNSYQGSENYNYNYDKFVLGMDGMSIQEIIEAGFGFDILFNSEALKFINVYGIKNIVEFDRDCGHAFSKDNFALLKSIFDMYLHYGNGRFYTRPFDEADRPYTKEEFYSAMKQMIMHGPTDGDYKGVSFDYREITGPFRAYASELFIDETLPSEIQTAFYTQQLQPSMLQDNLQLVEALRGKQLGACFKYRLLHVQNYDNDYKHQHNAYDYLVNLGGHDRFMDFLVKNGDLFNIVCDHYYYLEKYKNIDDFTVEETDTFDDVVDKMLEQAYVLITSTNVKYNAESFSLLKTKYPDLFINESAPKELQDKFYNREIDLEYIHEHPEYIEYLRTVNVEVIFKPLLVIEEGYRSHSYNFIETLKNNFGNGDSFDILIAYGRYLEIANKNGNKFVDLRSNKVELLNFIEQTVYETIMNGQAEYVENMPHSFKEKYPSLFLPDNAPKELKDMFYSRTLTLEIIKQDPNLLSYFENTDITFGFPLQISWLASTFNGVINAETTNKKLKIIEAYFKISDKSLQEIFSKYVSENYKTIDTDKLDELTVILQRLSFSNSSEMLAFRTNLATQILASPNPKEALDRVEEIFLTNNIPVPGKIYSVFQILHPHCSGFDFNNEQVSPVLAQSGQRRRDAIIFADLLRVSLGSNNRSMRDYLANIENGHKLFTMISNGEVKVEELDGTTLSILNEYSAHLCALYNNTMMAKLNENRKLTLTGDAVADINKLISLFSINGKLDYNLPDRIISMYCHYAGFETFEEAKQYFIKTRETADKRNREQAQQTFTLQKGDMVKGINNFKYLHNILQNGSVAKEFLGDCATSDRTPLDTDLSMIYDQKDSLGATLNFTEAAKYGDIWLVLKKDDRFSVTRTSDASVVVADEEIKYDPDKLELFVTGATGKSHYGIRTGFASSDINYIVVENYDKRIGLEITMNGFYIPVITKDGTLVFSPEDYDLLRSNMAGLSYYDENQYSCSAVLETEETLDLAEKIPLSDMQVANKRMAINYVIGNAIKTLGLFLKDQIDGDLTEGSVELIDTGSTGRGTNMPGDGDFDFMMRLDKSIFTNPTKLRQLKNVLITAFGEEHASEIIATGDFRLKNVYIQGLTDPVDIDITFVEKTNKLTYSTDMALQDRLNTIRTQSPDKYNLVVANILLAKKVLKEAGVYKPNRGETPQGGLGGVGIENWVLQHNGSFIEAAKSFLDNSEGKTFEEFCEIYQVWDFGENHLADKKGYYNHDNFVTNNMSAEGYEKMRTALKDYLNKLQVQNTDVRTR